MKALSTALQEIYGLFVEDGSLAVAILVWLGAAAFIFPRLPGAASWRAPLLFAGLVMLLLENVWRTGRKR